MMDKKREKHINEEKTEQEVNREEENVEIEDKEAEEPEEKKDVVEPTVTTTEEKSSATGGAPPPSEPVDSEEPLLKFDKEAQNLEADQRRVLETQVKEELKKAGLDTRGQKIQVKIISGLNKDEKLTDDDSQTFKRMVVAILGRNADEDAASDREDSMTSAYNYRWRPEQPVTQEEEQK